MFATAEGSEKNSELQQLELSRGSSNENLHDDNPNYPIWHLNVVLVATEHFSDRNILGEGGFGPVYKVCNG